MRNDLISRDGLLKTLRNKNVPFQTDVNYYIVNAPAVDGMITPFKNDMFTLIWQAFKNLYPDKDCECYWEPEIRDDENGNTVYGLTDFGADGTVAVFVTPTLNLVDAAEILAHELAHVAVGVGHGHDEAWEKAFDNIFKEYNRLGDELFEEGDTNGQ